MPQDPSILTIPDGPPFFTAPDGTKAPLFGGEADLTGLPITAAPNRTGNKGLITDVGPSVLPPLLADEIIVTQLYNVDPVADVGAFFFISKAEVPVPGAPAPNDGEYTVTAVIDANSVQALKVSPLPPSPILPELNNGHLSWILIKFGDFNQGDPLTYLTKLNTPLRVNNPAAGPAAFADYVAEQEPVVVNDSSGLFGKVQVT